MQSRGHRQSWTSSQAQGREGHEVFTLPNHPAPRTVSACGAGMLFDRESEGRRRETDDFGDLILVATLCRLNHTYIIRGPLAVPHIARVFASPTATLWPPLTPSFSPMGLAGGRPEACFYHAVTCEGASAYRRTDLREPAHWEVQVLLRPLVGQPFRAQLSALSGSIWLMQR